MLPHVTDRGRELLRARVHGLRVGSLGRARSTVRRIVIVLVVGLVCAGCTPPRLGFGLVAAPPVRPVDSGTDRPVSPLRHHGRLFTDQTGRVVMLRGMNFVEKWAPFTPAADGFDDDDAALLAEHGFNTLRLGVPLEFVMPEPGQVDRAYL